MKTTAILTLTVLATITSAQSFVNPLEDITTQFKISEEVHPTATGEISKNGWPAVQWPGDSEQPGVLYNWNETTQELTQVANTTFTTYLDVTHNREKVITHTTIPDLGFTEIITYFDLINHVAYQKIPKIEQCKIVNLPDDFNITKYVADATNETAGFTTYQGIVSLPWVKDSTFHKFQIAQSFFNQTAFFCTKSLQIKWQIPESNPNLVINFPNGVIDRVFTDADFDGLTCQSDQAPIPFDPFKEGGIFS